MKKSRIQINQKIEVAVDPQDGFYKSLVQEVDEEKLSITIPGRQGKNLILHEGDRVHVRFTVKDAAYSFESTVMDRKKSNQVILFVLGMPAVLSRIQRRNFVRFPVVLKAVFQVLAPEPSPEYHGNTVDISGGGAHISSAVKVEKGDCILLRIHLGGVPKEISVQGEVRWTVEDDWLGVHRFGVNFTEISEAEQERIISFIFRQMRQRTQVK
jgi:c-di-GMP-binding flagellar brake protein YcgR